MQPSNSIQFKLITIHIVSKQLYRKRKYLERISSSARDECVKVMSVWQQYTAKIHCQAKQKKEKKKTLFGFK